MSKSKSLGSARQEFLNYYCQILPEYTPETLEAFLSIRNPPVILVSPLHEKEVFALWHKSHISPNPLPWFPNAYSWPKDVPPGTSLPGFKEGWIYALNPSSLFPVLAMGLKPQDSILDASAAPGGKTLAMINYLSSHTPHVLANDASLPRFKRLRSSLKFYGYPDIPTLCSPIQALKYKLQGQFDKILLDAPCSSEKHVFNSKRHIKIWSPNHSQNLSHLQSLLLESLIPLLKPGGKLVYSTCSINPQENQGVIAASLQNHPDLIQIPFTQPEVAPSDPMFITILSRQH